MDKNFLKKALVVGAIAFGGKFTKAQESPQKNKEASKQEAQDTTGRFDIQKLYKENEKEYDEQFIHDEWVEISPLEFMIVKFRGKGKIEVSVRKKDAKGNTTSRDNFEDLNELGKKYPKYKNSVDTLYLLRYTEHMHDQVWAKILSDKKETLKNNFENYVPSPEEIKMIESLAERKNKGEKIDGYDDLILFYNKDIKSEEDIYKFYMKYDGTPEALISHVFSKYLKPLFKENK